MMSYTFLQAKILFFTETSKFLCRKNKYFPKFPCFIPKRPIIALFFLHFSSSLVHYHFIEYGGATTKERWIYL